MYIGELGRRTNTKVPTIRFYEQIGLLGRPARTPGGRRTYSAGDLERLGLIRRARSLGFSIDEIRSLLQLSREPGGDCGCITEIARGHLISVEEKIATLERLRAELTRLTAICDGGSVAGCRVLQVLGDPAAASLTS